MSMADTGLKPSRLLSPLCSLNPLVLGILVTAPFFLIKLVLLAVTPFELAPDEAYYWTWSQQLDYAYYSKGPVVALLIAASTYLLGHSSLAVRLPALCTATIFFVIFFVAATRLFPAQIAAKLTILVQLLLFFGFLGLGMTTDAPFFLFWLSTLLSAILAIKDDKPNYWIVAGGFAGLAVLSKYTALLLPPAILMYLASFPKGRSHLKSKGLALGSLLFVLLLIPLLVWNYQHGWSNFAHNASHLYSQKEVAFRPIYLLDLLGSQWGLTGVLFFPLLVLALIRASKVWRQRKDEIAGLLVFTTLPLILVCLVVALTRRVYANWPMPIFINAALLVGYLLQEHPRMVISRGLILTAVGLNAVVLVPAYVLLTGLSFGVPLHLLPTKKLIGWKDLGQRVEGILQKEDDLIVITDQYSNAAQISFYAPSRPRTYCFNTGERRMNQFDIWGGWSEIAGRKALIVQNSPSLHPEIAHHFRAFHAISSPQPVTVGGKTVRIFYFFIGVDFNGLPPAKPPFY